MATISYIFFTVILLSSLLGSDAHGGRDPASYHVVSVRSLLPAAVCSISKGFKQRGLKVVHRHGPCSSVAQEKQTPYDILRQDESRVEWLRSRLSIHSQRLQVQDTRIAAHSGASLGTGNYIVTVGFGTPKRDLSLVLDTGSELTWIQCKPCLGCHPQKDPFFDPSLSSSYFNISCKSPDCSQLSDSSCDGSTCLYEVRYGDTSRTNGSFARETLRLTPNDVFPNFKFGCGQNNQGLFGHTDGLIGLGRDPVSLVSQTAQKFRSVFSYCLPSTSSSPGYLAFGPSQNSSAIAYTQLLTNPNAPTFYFVDLIGIKLERKALPISRSVFSSIGTFIDSGTVITRLPQSAYETLRSAFKQYMAKSKYPLVKRKTTDLLDTCYNIAGYEKIDIPEIALRYRGGVSMDLDPGGIIYFENQSIACLAFAASDDGMGIIGNVQQKTFEVVHDLGKKKIGFRPRGCS